MNLNNDIAVVRARPLRLGPLHQLHPGRARSLIPSPHSPSSFTSLCRVLACKVAAPSVVPGRVIGQKRIDQNLGLARLDAKCGMAVPCLFHRNCLLGLRSESLMLTVARRITRLVKGHGIDLVRPQEEEVIDSLASES